MHQTLRKNYGKKKNIVLVGVAGVGKTTLGEIASEKLNMAFVDMDLSFEAAENADIDTLVDRYGEDGFNQQLLLRFEKQVRTQGNTIFAASARVSQYKLFWALVKRYGISVHVQGKPLEVYMRQDMWVNGRKITPEEKSDKWLKSEFNGYYTWLIKYCKKADHTVRVVGDKQIDAETLCKTIKRLISVDDTKEEDVSN
jgi:shikimate kinase